MELSSRTGTLESFSDETLWDRIKGGDRAAYGEIYDRYKGMLFLHANRMLRNNEEAEDVIHDLFALLWNKRSEIHITTQLRYYLYTSLKNNILKMLAHKKVGDTYIASLPENNNSLNNADHLVREKLLSLLIEKEINALPPKMRAVFELSRKENLSHKEISEQLDISEQTVRKHIQHALKILRVKIRVAISLLI